MKRLITAGLFSCAVLLTLQGKSVADGYWCDTCYSPPVYYAPPVYYTAPVYYPPRVTYYAPVPYYGAYYGHYRPYRASYPRRSVYRIRQRTVYRGW